MSAPASPTAEPLRRCKHDVSEDCPACAEETIAGLKARVDELEAALLEVRRYAKRIRNSSQLVGPAEYNGQELKIWQRALYHEGKTIEGMVKAATRGAEIFEPEKPAIAALPPGTPAVSR